MPALADRLEARCTTCSCTGLPGTQFHSPATWCGRAGLSWERLGLNETFGLLPFEVHAPGELWHWQVTLTTALWY